MLISKTERNGGVTYNRVHCILLSNILHTCLLHRSIDKSVAVQLLTKAINCHEVTIVRNNLFMSLIFLYKKWTLDLTLTKLVLEV